jgi:hypothetical protein
LDELGRCGRPCLLAPVHLSFGVFVSSNTIVMILIFWELVHGTIVTP